MRRFVILTVLACLCAAFAFAQSRGGNWPTYGGDAQRSGWEGTDARISKDTVKDLQLLFKIKLESQAKGTRPLLPPVIMGRLISYRGFRELAFVGSNADIVYAIDADLGTIFWQKHLEYSTREPQVTASTPECPGGMTATPTMSVPGVTAPRGAGPAPVRGGAAPVNNWLAGPASVYAISSDGRLHRLNVSTGDDMLQPIQVLPANSNTSSLVMVNGVIYAVTSPACYLTQNAVWSIDLTGEVPKVASFALNAGGDVGLGGATIGSDGTIYVHAGTASGDASRKWFPTLMALDPADLRPRQSYNTFDVLDNFSFDAYLNATSPVVFSYKNRDLIAGVTWDDRLYLVDSASKEIGGPMYRTWPIDIGHGIRGSLSSWQDSTGTRWVLAPVWGPLHRDFTIPRANGATPNGAVVAFKLEENNGRTVLTPAWVSRDMISPLPPVIASGVVFALSAGKGGTRATLYALDAATGKELYSSRNLVAAPASHAGMTVSNGRVYFSTLDGTMYGFGMFMEH